MAGLLLHTLPQPLKLGVSLNGLLGEGIVEPPVDQRRHGGEAGGDELLELGALDGQHGLACGAQDLVDKGQRQHGGAGDGGSGDGGPWLGCTAPCRCHCRPSCDRSCRGR